VFGRGSIQLARVFGIRIGVHPSWFLVLFLIIFLLSGTFQQALGGPETASETEAYLTAVGSALLFFLSLVLHELGHALVARRQGIGIVGIDLFFFGGIAKMTRDTDSPGTEFKVSAAGPLVTLLVVLGCAALGTLLVGGEEFERVVALQAGATSSAAVLALGWLTLINALVLLFNLIPAFPLDGGRIARAVAWKLTGSRGRATRVAGRLGQAFAFVMIALGAYLLFEGLVAAGIWMIVLGFFLGSAARNAVVQTAFSERLAERRVADIMDPEPVSIPDDVPVERALEDWFLRYGWDFFPVVDGWGRFLGVVRRPRLEQAVSTGRGGAGIAELVGDDPGQWRVSHDASLEALLGSESLRRLGALMAVDGDGVLRGVVTFEQTRRALSSAVEPREPASHPGA
jgi:Zn-dependent protease